MSHQWDVSDTARYYDSIAPFYFRFWGRHLHWGMFEGEESLEEGARRATRYFLDALALPPGARVGDLACGSGAVAAAARARGWKVVGVDVSIQQLRLLRGSGEPSPALNADVVRLPLRDAVFDGVSTVSAFYHFHAKGEALREIARVLRPGGRFVFDDFVELADLGAEREDIFERQRITSLATPDSYRRDLVRAGFAIESEIDLTAHFATTYRRAVERLDALSAREAAGIDTARLRHGYEVLARCADARRAGWWSFACVRR